MQNLCSYKMVAERGFFLFFLFKLRILGNIEGGMGNLLLSINMPSIDIQVHFIFQMLLNASPACLAQ